MMEPSHRFRISFGIWPSIRRRQNFQQFGDLDLQFGDLLEQFAFAAVCASDRQADVRLRAFQRRFQVGRMIYHVDGPLCSRRSSGDRSLNDANR
jgi:hypothetical protein